MTEPRRPHSSPFNVIAIVAALGYFVDIYDLILFGIVRVPSLKDLGLSGTALNEAGDLLLNMQMIGLLVGGILWGVLGDLRGRLSVLFGSIIVYSLANLANGLVHDIDMYAALRFIAGVGLAGELGAGITLVNETMARESRGWGTTLVASFGVLGAVLAFGVAEIFDWRTAYFVGGGLGLVLLALRFSTYESGLFETVRHSRKQFARFDLLFRSARRLGRYFACVGLGVPIWFTVGLFVFLAHRFGEALHLQGAVTAGQAIMWTYIGLAAGDLTSGWLSQRIRSRRRAVFAFVTLLLMLDAAFLLALEGAAPGVFYGHCVAMGFAAGYWALFVTIASEQFGTNLRATVTTTVPNFVRGAVVPIVLGFNALVGAGLGMLGAAAIVGAACFGIAYLSIATLRETFAIDLDYNEE